MIKSISTTHKRTILTITAIFFGAVQVHANTGSSREFSDTTLKAWEEKSFEGNTNYELVNKDGLRALKAQTMGEASVLYKEEKISLANTPMLDWHWKIENTYSITDETSKDGDDFPARLYVVVKTGFLPWDTLAINYVWSSNMPKGSSWPNPFTDKAQMVAVQSGNQLQGQWIQQKRDVAKDFKDTFGIDVDQIDGFAVMVDGDNSGANGTAYFGNIEFKAH